MITSLGLSPMRKTRLFFFLVLLNCLISGCYGNRARSVSSRPGTQPHEVTNFAVSPLHNREIRTIAVLPFVNSTSYGGIGSKVADMFNLQLLKTGRFKVLEPYKLREILGDDLVAMAPATSPELVNKLGKELAVQGLVFGTITEYRPYIARHDFSKTDYPPIVGINVKMVDSKSGVIVWAASDTFNGFDSNIQALMPPDDRWKVSLDINFLTELLVKELSKTINY